jgi:hypothetical protein
VSGDLFVEHQAIIEAAEAFLAAIKQEPRIPMDQLSRLRVKFSSLIRQHRATEEEHIYGPLTREGSLGKLPQLEPHVQDVMREKAKYSLHVRKWTPQAILANWDGYVAAVEDLLTGVKRTIAKEETSVYKIVLNLTPSAQGLALRRN